MGNVGIQACHPCVTPQQIYLILNGTEWKIIRLNILYLLCSLSSILHNYKSHCSLFYISGFLISVLYFLTLFCTFLSLFLNYKSWFQTFIYVSVRKLSMSNTKTRNTFHRYRFLHFDAKSMDAHATICSFFLRMARYRWCNELWFVKLMDQKFIINI